MTLPNPATKPQDHAHHAHHAPLGPYDPSPVLHRLNAHDSHTHEDRRPLILHARVIAGAAGGPDKTILRSPHHLHSRLLRMEALYIHPPGDPVIDEIRTAADCWHCPLHTIAERGPIDPRTVVRALQICRQHHVTIWHAHDHKTNALGLMLRRWWPMKLITTVHGWVDRDWRTRLYRQIDYFCLKRYDHVVTVSPPLAEDCPSHGTDPRRTLLIPNGIDPLHYQRDDNPEHNQALRREMGIDPKAFVIGVVGRLSAEKGVDRALRCLHTLKKDHGHVQFLIVGDGRERARLEKLAGELNIADAVRWCGWSNELRPLYSVMDTLLLPSYREGLPNAALEAMAMRVPVAATAVGALPQLLDFGRCGVVLDCAREAGWPAVLRPLIVSQPRREELARRARQRIEEKYSFEHRMEKLKALYKKMLRLPGHIDATPIRRAA